MRGPRHYGGLPVASDVNDVREGLLMDRSRLNSFKLGLATALLLLWGQSAYALPFVSGDIFAAVSGGGGSGDVQHYNAAGVLLETLLTGKAGFNTGMAFDAFGNLHVTNLSTNSISVFNNQGVLQAGTCCPGSGNPESITFDSAGNRYVTYVNGGVGKWSPTGVQIGGTIQPGTRFDWGDLKADQKTFLFTQEGTRIGTLDVSTGLFGSDFASGLGGQAFALRVLSDGRVLLANGSSVVLLSAAGAVIGSYDVANEDSWFSLNVNPDGTSFWSGDYATGKLYEFNIQAGTHLDDFTQTIDTGTGNYRLFGIAIFGEITQGCGDNCGGGVPEPATLLLLGSGLILTIAVRRRARRSASGRRA
jgi:hypothetical protein